MVAGAPSTDDHHSQQHYSGYEQSRAGYSAPSYTPVVHPSDIYSRPSAPSEAVFNFSDDATIAPDDSVSQLDRRFTGRRMAGPRPMEPSIPSVPELPTPASYHHAPPATLEDDKSTIIANTQERAPSRGAESTRAPTVQSYTPRTYAKEEEEFEEPVRGNGPGYSTSAALPLVPGSMNGRQEGMREGGSGVSAYQAPIKGYAALGRDDEEEQAYSAYSRGQDPKLEDSIRNVRNGQDSRDTPTLASAWANPLGYLRKSRGDSSYGDSQKDSYPPGAFGMEEINKPSGPPSINIVEAQDQDPALMRTAPYWQRMLWDRSPNQIRIAERKRGDGIQRRPWASWVLSVVFCIVMVIEMVRMAQVCRQSLEEVDLN